jgi:PAS domain-containing protein
MRWYEGLAGAPYDIEHRLLVDGQVKWVREKAYLEFDDTGNPLGAFGITQDITERVEAEKAVKESEEKYRSLFDNMSEGFGLHEIILDADGKPCDYRFLEINDAFERLTGLSRDKILGRTVKDVMPDIEPHWFETYGRVALRSGLRHIAIPQGRTCLL